MVNQLQVLIITVSSAKTDIFIGNNATAAFVLTEAP
jgi:hypothetical protein